MKQNQFKIIMIQEVSHLKIYEDFDEIYQYTDKNNQNRGNQLETLDISEVTVYENLRFLRNDLEVFLTKDFSIFLTEPHKWDIVSFSDDNPCTKDVHFWQSIHINHAMQMFF